MLLEVRLDRCQDLALAPWRALLAAVAPERLVITYRDVAEVEPGAGIEGARQAGVARRLAWWARAWTAGVGYVDIELATWQAEATVAVAWAQRSSSATRLILSQHDFVGMAPLATLLARRRAAEAAGADLVKLAATPADVHEQLIWCALLHDPGPWQRPLLGIAMGEAGLWSRVLAPRFPRPAPFVYAHHGAVAMAPGQVHWRTLRDRYRFLTLGPTTPIYGLMGDPVRQSRSPALHNAALILLDLPGCYLPFAVAASPRLFVEALAPQLGIRGLSVTAPHKEAVLPACRELSALARRIGAVNTLLWLPEGGWRGDNTDAPAALASLRAALQPGGQAAQLAGLRVLLLGAGGVARAIGEALRAAGADVAVTARRPAAAAALAAALAGRTVLWRDLPAAAGVVDVLVQATPVGMAPGVSTSPLTPAQMPRAGLVWDTIYAPAETQLMALALARGIPVLGGADMFYRQAAAQVALFTGKEVVLEVLVAAMREDFDAA